MHLEYSINKPVNLSGYALHRMVAGLTEGEPSLFSDAGDTLLLRTDRKLEADCQAVRTLDEGSLSAFELRACVSKKCKGKHIYYPINNWRVRHNWLFQQGVRNGFEILTVHSWSKTVTIDDGSKRFTLDQTDFAGILRVTDKRLFSSGLINGIGSTAKTYGFGMLIIA